VVIDDGDLHASLVCRRREFPATLTVIPDRYVVEVKAGGEEGSARTQNVVGEDMLSTLPPGRRARHNALSSA
jgi:hypothetical protein